jgi:hypothetical protein
MAATPLNVVWRNPQPMWARQVEQAAGSLELVKTREPQRPQRSFGSILFCYSRPPISVAKVPTPLRGLFEDGGTGTR